MKSIIFTCITALVAIQLQAQDASRPLENLATVYILKTNINNGGMSSHGDLYLEDQYIGKTRDRDYIKLSLPEGKHLLWCRNANPTYLEMKLEANKTYVVDISFSLVKLRNHFFLSDFGACQLLEDKLCKRYFRKGLKRLNKLISKGKVFQLSNEDKTQNHKKRREEITQAIEDYNNGKTKWDVVTLETPVDLKL